MTQLLEKAFAEAAKLPEDEQNAVASRILEELRAATMGDIEDLYRQMATNESREAEALEWAEATVGDVSDEAR